MLHKTKYNKRSNLQLSWLDIESCQLFVKHFIYSASAEGGLEKLLRLLIAHRAKRRSAVVAGNHT